MKSPTPEELIRTINGEIEWCRKHPAQDVMVEYQDGFIAGLQQAIFLIEYAVEITRRENRVG